MSRPPLLFLSALALAAATTLQAAEPIQLASNPALSPDGKTLAFSWAGDIWTVPTAGGPATALTRTSFRERDPKFSPDGKSIAYVSNRDGSNQVYVVPARGGTPKQITHHTSGYSIDGWYPDGKSLLVSGVRDFHWRDGQRFFKIDAFDRGPDTLLFDAAGEAGSLSPDGTKVLFVREGPQWWRKGYVGSQSAQIWLFDVAAKSFSKILAPGAGALSPVWRPDGKGFYYAAGDRKNFNIHEYDLASKSDRALTRFMDDSTVQPAVSADGKTLVFRHLFDFYSLDLSQPEAKPVKIAVKNEGDPAREPTERRSLSAAGSVAFTSDGLEIAFTAGGDVWVMDTELREPKQLTNTPEEERDVVFAQDGSALFFVSDRDGRTDVWRADKGEKSLDWWRNTSFPVKRITDDDEVESNLKASPDGLRLGYLKGRGDVWVVQYDGNNARKIFDSWSETEFDFSPDGTWIVYANFDSDFNKDVWVQPIDGSKAPVNISRHPDNESDPVWSPDGRMIAFAGRRVDREVDIYYVHLQAADDQKTSREKTIEKAVDKMKKARTKGFTPVTKGARGAAPPAAAAAGAAAASTTAVKPKPKVAIDFDGLSERLHRISIPNSDEGALIWSPDSKKLGFRGSVDGRAGFYTVDVTDGARPSLVASPGGSQARWLEEGTQIVWLSQGTPASVALGGGGPGPASTPPSLGGSPFGRFGGGGASASPAPDAAPSGSGRETRYPFRALQVIDLDGRYRAGFDAAWRTMRDNWYDERLGNRDWNAVRRKYRDMAGRAIDNEMFATVVSLMLGELNGSHLGFTPGPASPDEPGPGPGPRRGFFAAASGEPGAWRPTTAHFGLRFVQDFPGPGLKVRDVLPGSPADRVETRIKPGEVVLAIDDVPVSMKMDLTSVLNGPSDRDAKLKVKGLDGKERVVSLRPTSFLALSGALYEKWIKDNRATVDNLSGGKLGYLHIRSMDFPSFYRFEEDLYAAGAGKDGLIIDVRENGGGSTADHLLTALTQPQHAIAVPRGGGPGYPQDRKVYATWGKPIVVLCNQNSFSNAEIFSHAIKTLKRGHLVGVPTAGGVVSTGATRIMDLGTLRLPTRGWFTIGDGEDMELHGAVPDHVLWPDPADFAKGIDVQLAKGVEVLIQDVKTEEAKPRPKLLKATERPN